MGLREAWLLPRYAVQLCLQLLYHGGQYWLHVKLEKTAQPPQEPVIGCLGLFHIVVIGYLRLCDFFF